MAGAGKQKATACLGPGFGLSPFHITSSPHPGTSLASLKMLAQKAFKLAAWLRGESAARP